MIELTYLQMAQPQFQNATNAIWNCPNLDAQTSYSAHRVLKAMEKAEKDVNALRQSILDKYAKKDEKGARVSDERGNIVFDPPEKVQEFEKEFLELFSKNKVTLKVTKIDFQKLTPVRGITPRDWSALEPIVDNLPQEETEEEVGGDAPTPKV